MGSGVDVFGGLLNILGWILLGLLAGLFARVVVPRTAGSPTVVLILLGIAGAMLFGFLGLALGLYPKTGAASFAAAPVGGLLLIGLYQIALRSRVRD